MSNVGLGDIARIQAQYLLLNNIQIGAIEKLTGLSRNSIGKLALNIENNQLISIHSTAFRNFDEIIEFHPLQPAETFETYFEIDNS